MYDNVNAFGENDFTRGRYAAETGIYARFYTIMQESEEKSAAAGRPIHVEKEFVEIIAAGNANNIIRREVTDEDKQRFARQYEIFGRDKDMTGEQLIGTPLVEVPWISKSQIHELAYMHIHTLEQLSGLDDNVCSKHAGLYDLKRKAVVSVKASNDAAPMTEMAEQIKQMKAQLEDLLLQNKALKEGIKK